MLLELSILIFPLKFNLKNLIKMLKIMKTKEPNIVAHINLDNLGKNLKGVI